MGRKGESLWSSWHCLFNWRSSPEKRRRSKTFCSSAAGVAIIISEGRYLLGVLLVFILFGVVKSTFLWVRHLIKHLDKDADEDTEVSSIDI